MYYLRDPNNGRMIGPFDTNRIRAMYSGGECTGWELARQANGPWVRLDQLEGLVSVPSAGDAARAYLEQPLLPPEQDDATEKRTVSTRPADPQRALKERIRQELRDKIVYWGSVGQFAGHAILIILLSGAAVGGFVWARAFTEKRAMDAMIARARHAPTARERRPVQQIATRYQNKFQDLYDAVKGGLARFKHTERRNIMLLATDIADRRALLQFPREREDLHAIHNNLMDASRALIAACEYFSDLHETEVSLATSGDPYEVGGMSSDTRGLLERVKRESDKAIQANLSISQQKLAAIESDPMFDALME